MLQLPFTPSRSHSPGILRALARSLSILLSVALTACATNTAGRWYTVVKLDQDQRTLREARSVRASEDPASSYDREIAIGDPLAISLGGGFLKYLNDADRPEVLVFSRVLVREPGESTEAMIHERVFVNTEDKELNLTLSEEAGIPRMDIPLLPPIRYEGQDIVVQLRIIELDQDDAERYRSLINAAASTSAVFSPSSAAAASVFQSVLSFLTRNNPDDVEFQFDFGLSCGTKPIELDDVDSKTQKRQVRTYEHVLQPRTLKYFVIKTEHRRRLHVPNNYFDAAEGSVRYFGAQAVKLLTLGILNWPIWNQLGAHEEDDAYLWLFGRPLGIAQSSWQIPEFRDQSLTLARRHERRLAAGMTYRLEAYNDDLYLVPDSAASGSVPVGNRQLFTDQGYLKLSVYSPNVDKPLDTGELRQQFVQSDVVKNLRVTQMTFGEFNEALKPLTASLQNLGAQHRIKPLLDRLRKAKTPESVDAIQLELETALGELERLDVPAEVLDPIRVAGQTKLTAKRQALIDDAPIRLAGGPYVQAGTDPVTILVVARTELDLKFAGEIGGQALAPLMASKQTLPETSHWTVQLASIATPTRVALHVFQGVEQKDVLQVIVAPQPGIERCEGADGGAWGAGDELIVHGHGFKVAESAPSPGSGLPSGTLITKARITWKGGDGSEASEDFEVTVKDASSLSIRHGGGRLENLLTLELLTVSPQITAPKWTFNK